MPRGRISRTITRRFRYVVEEAPDVLGSFRAVVQIRMSRLCGSIKRKAR
jgi:hypothetical protein